MAPFGVHVRGKERRIDRTRDDIIQEFSNIQNDEADLSVVPYGFQAQIEDLDVVSLLNDPDTDRKVLLECFERDLLAVIGALPYSTESTILSKYCDLMKVNVRKVLQKLHYPNLEELLMSKEMRDKVQTRVEEDGERRFHVVPTPQNHHLIEAIMITEQAVAEMQRMNIETNEMRLLAMRSNRTVLENRLIMVRMLAECGCEGKAVQTTTFQKFYQDRTGRSLNSTEWMRMFRKSKMISAITNYFYNDVYLNPTDKGMMIKLRRPVREIEDEIFEELDAQDDAPIRDKYEENHDRQVAGGTAPNPLTILRTLNPISHKQADAEDEKLYDNIPLSMPELKRIRKKLPQTVYNPRPVRTSQDAEEYDPKPRGLRPAMEDYMLEKDYNNKMDIEEEEEYRKKLLEGRMNVKRNMKSNNLALPEEEEYRKKLLEGRMNVKRNMKSNNLALPEEEEYRKKLPEGRMNVKRNMKTNNLAMPEEEEYRKKLPEGRMNVKRNMKTNNLAMPEEEEYRKKLSDGRMNVKRNMKTNNLAMRAMLASVKKTS